MTPHLRFEQDTVEILTHYTSSLLFSSIFRMFHLSSDLQIEGLDGTHSRVFITEELCTIQLLIKVSKQ